MAEPTKPKTVSDVKVRLQAIDRKGFAVEPWDLSTMIATAALLTTSVLLASFLPARRAAIVNTIDVLRAK